MKKSDEKTPGQDTSAPSMKNADKKNAGEKDVGKRGFTRRKFMVGAGVGAGAVVGAGALAIPLSRSPYSVRYPVVEQNHADLPPNGKSVVIIGGGLAGLQAGVEMSSRGFEVTVLEKTGLPGGKLKTWRDRNFGPDDDPMKQDPNFKGYVREHGIHAIWGFYNNLREFLHRHGWGLGWDLGTYDGDTVVHRFGGFSGFHSHLSFMPDHDIGIAILVNNAGAGGRLANTISTAIYDVLLGKPNIEARIAERLVQVRNQAAQAHEDIRQDIERRASRPQTLPYPLDAYVGVYDSPALGRMEWSLVDGKLHVAMGVARSVVEVYDAEANQLRVELTGGGSVVGFTFEGQRATSVIFSGQTFSRVGS